jgi:hypothetical protein
LSHWDTLEPEALERLRPLAFRELCEALLDYAPSASASDLHAELAEVYPETPKAEYKRVRAQWKASRDLRAQTNVTDQAREEMMQALMRAAAMKDPNEVIKCVDALASLRGVTVASRSSGQDWSRLTRAEEDELIRLVHKLHGKELDEGE